MRGALIVGFCNAQGRFAMLILAAIARFARPSELESNDLLVHSRIGHVGLTVIALVYVLITLWQQ
jgi:hypothetical protein